MARLFVVATPIGNLSDLTARAEEVLRQSRRVLAEDTRRARVLLRRAGAQSRPVSLHARNEASRVALARRWLSQGEDVVLVSDAGTPLLSDPGDRLVRAALEDGHSVVPVPGASAVLAALVVSGLPCVPFTFVGFPPRTAGKRDRLLDRIAHATETVVLFESPERLLRTLEDLAARAGSDRRLAVCRELTKVHEEVFRGTLAQAARRFQETPARGEVTVVVEGGAESADPARARSLARSLVEQGLGPPAAARAVAEGTGVSRSRAYQLVQDAKERGGAPDGPRAAVGNKRDPSPSERRR